MYGYSRADVAGEAAERRTVYEDRVREAIAGLRSDIEGERAEIERLRGLLSTARSALLAIFDDERVLPLNMRGDVWDALRGSDPEP